MGSCNDFQATFAASAPNPTLHVNYTKGMILGVDDLVQEFAYLANRDQWALRELIGYGTASGLAVRVDDTPGTADDPGGPRVRVCPGTAVVPSGKLVCVPNEQCATLNQWLARPDNARVVESLLATGSPPASPPGSPPAGGGTLSLYLTLCYADCTTLPVPIPGDPCRSDDQLMAPSRIADDYRLELRTEPPAQVEEDALRDFAAWLRQVPVVDGSPPAALDAALLAHWAEGIRLAAKPWLDGDAACPRPSAVDSPPASPPRVADYLYDSPPTALSVAPDHLAAFLGVAMRIWVTELRPIWMARTCAADAKSEHDCVLLARLAVPVVRVGSPSGNWQVDGTGAGIEIDESQRPFLMHGRLFQEWLLGFGLPGADSGLPLPLAGHLLIGDGSAWIAKALSGSPGELTVTETPLAVELGLPQAIGPASSPRFAGITINGVATTRLLASGGHRVAIRTVNADYTPRANDYCIVCIGMGITVTLPKCTRQNRGQVYVLKNGRTAPALPSMNATIATQPGDNLEGTTTLSIAPEESFRFVSDGDSNWYRI